MAERSGSTARSASARPSGSPCRRGAGTTTTSASDPSAPEPRVSLPGRWRPMTTKARPPVRLAKRRASGGTGLAGGLEHPALLVDGAVGLRRLEDEGVVVLGVRARPVGALVVAAAQILEVIPAVADQADQVFDRRALELQPGPAAELAEQDRVRERTVHVILVAVGPVRRTAGVGGG